MSIRAVVFDLGGTLLDETRFYEEWADWLEVPRHEFLEALMGLIARGEDHRLLFERYGRGAGLDQLIRHRAETGMPQGFRAEDLYPGAKRCLAELSEAGYLVGVAGNQGMFEEDLAKVVGLEVDISRAGNEWIFEKPDPRFFDRLVADAGCAPGEVVYVGDRVDNDIVPAKDRGLKAILITTGPWGQVHADRPGAERADAIVDGLTEVAGAVSNL